MRTLPGLVLLPPFLAATVSATVLHVPDPYPTIAAGLAAAVAGDTVEVACGEYLEHDLAMKSGVLLRSELGTPECVNIDAQRLGRVIHCDSTGEGTRLVGMTMTGGGSVLRGGGIYLVGGTVSVEHCMIRNNGADRGGGIANSGGTLYVKDSVIRENGGWRGSGIVSFEFVEAERTMIVANRHRNYDEGAVGGAGELYGHASFIDCVIDSNWATDGGAFVVYGNLESQTLIRCSISHNRAVGFHEQKAGPGCMYLQDAAMRLVDCEIRGNTSSAMYYASTGGFALFHGALTMEGCVVADNVGQPGAIYGSDCDVSARGTLFLRNRGSHVGGIQVSGVTGRADIRSSTFEANGATPGTSAVSSIHIAGGAQATVHASIFAFNGPGLPVAGSFVQASCTNVFGNAGGDWVGALAGQDSIPGNVSVDPLFCQPAVDDYHLQWGSPCLPANSGGCGLIGAYGFGGCGSVAIRPESWSRIKAAFRD